MPGHRMQTFSHKVELPNDDFTLVTYISMQWSAWVEEDRDEDALIRDICNGMDNSTPGRSFSCFLKVWVGPVHKEVQTRRRVRIGMWSAPAIDDFNNPSNVGICIDDCNESEVQRGELTSFHFRELVVPQPEDGEDAKRVLVPATSFFVEWCDVEDVLRIIPAAQMPIATMSMVVHDIETFGKAAAAKALERKPCCLPEAPQPKPRSEKHRRQGQWTSLSRKKMCVPHGAETDERGEVSE